MLTLTITKRTDPRLLALMERHYSQPKGFVGRNICYAIEYDGVFYGYTVSGSATRYLPGRNEALGITIDDIGNVINNIFFHVEPGKGYPVRNFVPKVIAAWRERAKRDWRAHYFCGVVGFETLVELPRTGECYLRDGWQLVGQTKGYTCKREGGIGTDDYGGKRVWDTVNLRPKLVFVRKLDD